MPSVSVPPVKPRPLRRREPRRTLWRLGLQGLGGYSGQERTVLMVVVSQSEVARLKALIREVDPHAFVILSDTTEVLGQGFKLHA